MDQERRKRNRFMGWVLILVILLFILPTYNLYQSYQTLLQRREQYSKLQEKYQTLSEEKVYQSDIATKLKMTAMLLSMHALNTLFKRG